MPRKKNLKGARMLSKCALTKKTNINNKLKICNLKIKFSNINLKMRHQDLKIKSKNCRQMDLKNMSNINKGLKNIQKLCSLICIFFKKLQKKLLKIEIHFYCKLNNLKPY